jgi:hypothetical protein
VTCPDCEEAWTSKETFLVGVGEANVRIVACRKHAAILIEALRKAREREEL